MPPGAILDMTKLGQDLDDVISEMEACAKSILEAQEKKDEKEVARLNQTYEELKVRSKRLEEAVNKAEEAGKLQATRNRVKELAKMDDNEPSLGGRGAVGKTDANPKDHVRDEWEKSNVFFKYVKGHRLSDNERKALQPQSPRFRDEDASDEAKDSVVIPSSLAAKVMGRNYAQTFQKGPWDPMLGMRGKVLTTLASDADGAVNLVPEEFRAQLLQLPFDQPTIMDLVSIVPTGTGNLTFPQLVQTDGNEFGGVSFTWIQEAAEKGETEPTFSQTEIPAYELAGYTEVSERALSRSAIGLEAFLGVLFRSAMAFEMDKQILNGNGSSKPTGIIHASGVRSIQRETVGEVNYEDLVRLKRGPKPQVRPGAYYFMHDDVGTEFELKKDSEGRPLFKASVMNGPFDRLNGYPYRENVIQPGVGTNGDIVFGNPRWYILAMEEEITLRRSEHAQFRKNRIAFKIFTVVGGKPFDGRAFAILSNEAS